MNFNKISQFVINFGFEYFISHLRLWPSNGGGSPCYWPNTLCCHILDKKTEEELTASYKIEVHDVTRLRPATLVSGFPTSHTAILHDSCELLPFFWPNTRFAQILTSEFNEQLYAVHVADSRNSAIPWFDTA